MNLCYLQEDLMTFKSDLIADSFLEYTGIKSCNAFRLMQGFYLT